MIVELVCKKLGFEADQLLAFASTCPHRYKTYQIPKKTGGVRTIAQPARELKSLQRYVLRKHLSRLPVHPAATAYRQGKGIVDNALRHRKNAFILRMDFRNFFPSIVPSDLIRHVARHNRDELSEGDRDFLAGLFFYKQKDTGEKVLSIGAPSSPFLSNTIMYEFDVQVQKTCDEHEVCYTRYADDLTLSACDYSVLQVFPQHIESVLEKLEYPRLRTNTQKTAFLSKKGRRNVTGLVITNEEKVSIGRSKKRQIKSLVFRCQQGSISQEEAAYLEGYLWFVKDVEPTFLRSLERKYGVELISQIMKPLSEAD